MRTIISLLCFTVVLLSFLGCSSSKSKSNSIVAPASGEAIISGRLEVSYDTGFGEVMRTEIPVLYGKWTQEKISSRNFVSHSICLSDGYIYGTIVTTEKQEYQSPNPIGVCFVINDKPNTVLDWPVTVGEYRIMGSDTGKMAELPDRLLSTGISVKNSKMTNSITPLRASGFVKIISSTKSTVKGEISIGDGKNKVNGEFFLTIDPDRR